LFSLSCGSNDCAAHSVDMMRLAEKQIGQQLGCLFCNAATGFCGRNATQKVAMTTKMAAAR
jgi:cell fate regulator YaaT (PSP1 superfamily)